MSLPALPVNADTRSITDRVNVLIRDYNNPPAAIAPQRYVPAGTVLPFGGATAPAGFLLCYGQAVSRTGYADLFAAIGTAHGAGDGSTTFNVPDYRGRTLAGLDNMGGMAANRLTSGGSGIAGTTLGAVGGVETIALTVAQMPAHSHGINDPSHTHLYGVGGIPANGVNVRGTSGDGTNFGFASTNNAVTGISIQNAGSGGAHNNAQPTGILNFMVAT
jgi:microcystin-dependent protein